MLSQRFSELARQRRRALVVYLTAGFPTPAASVELARALEQAGADVIEWGIPFSDPMADGPVIQASSQAALEQGMTFDSALALLRDARLSIPVVIFTYLNPLLAAGSNALARAAEAGAHGVLVTDLPLGADPAREDWVNRGPLDFIRLAAPTTPQSRMAEITRFGRGFVYLISRAGVTGVRSQLPPELADTVARLRAVTSLPICVGFGVSTPNQAREVGRVADGVVVGSAIVQAARESVAAAATLARQLREALDAT